MTSNAHTIERRGSGTQSEHAARHAPVEPVELEHVEFPRSNAHLIPALAEQWQSLDLREILSRPAAFLSVSQSNSLYRPGGAEYTEGHAFRGSLPATAAAVRAARAADNSASSSGIG